MKKTLEIIRYELVSAIARKSYLAIAFGIPVLAVLIFAGISLYRSNRPAVEIDEQTQESFQFEVEGYVDQAGIISSFPEDIPMDVLVSYPNEEAAKSAMEKEEITGYYIIPEDYIESGEIIYVHPKVNPIAEGGQSWVMIKTLYFNLLGGNNQLAADIWYPANFVRKDISQIISGDGASGDECANPGFSCESNTIVQLLPIFVMAIIYISIITGGSYLLRLVSSEKDSRVMELLLLSASPIQLLTGKIISYCILGFLQVFAWLGAIYLVLRIGKPTLNLPSEFSLPISLLIWGLVFYVLGYAVYATLMAGAGALTPNVSQYTSVYFIVSSPLLISYFFSITLAMNPNSPLAVGLSIFPLSAPIMMITRLTVGDVPVWQPITAALLTIFLSLLIMRAVARMFRAQALLSGQPFSMQRYIRTLINFQ